MKFYLASGFSNRYNLRELAKELEKKGHTVQSSWIWLEERPSREDPNWDEFVQNIALDNLSNLEDSDAMIVDATGIRVDGNGGAHFEFGYGIAAQFTMFYVGERRNGFSWLPHIYLTVVENYEELLSIIPDGE